MIDDLFANAAHGQPVDPAAPATDRLFFALFPDAATADRIAALALDLRERHGLRGKVQQASRLHVTLHHLGDHAGVPQDIVAAAVSAADAVDATEFAVEFGRVVSFRSRGRAAPFVLLGGDGLVALHAFQRSLGDRMVRAGLSRHVERRFTPHVTLLYDDAQVPEAAVAPIAWQAREFALVHSLIGRTEHRVLGRWSLRS